MKFLFPIGLISLISLLILLLIYLIKPKYEIKKVSTTYIWELAKKHSKKRNKNPLRDIIILIIEILVLLLSVFLLSGGMIKKKGKIKEGNIIILDASLNMNIKSGEQTRFDKAISKIKEFSLKTTKPITIIYAGSNPRNICKNEKNNEKINVLLKDLEPEYGLINFDKLAKVYKEDIESFKSAETYFYTGKKYQKLDHIKKIDVSDKKEWNASIDSFNEEVKDGYYIFNAKISLYKAFTPLNIVLTVYDANKKGEVRKAVKRIYLASGETEKISFDELDIHTYTSAKLEIEIDTKVKDYFIYDDKYIISNGYKEKLNVTYSSLKANSFFLGSLYGLRDTLKETFDINISELHKEERRYRGFDLYIFEHKTPNIIPTDGVSLIVNPDKNIDDIGLIINKTKTGNFNVKKSSLNPLINYIDETKITVSKYKKVNTPKNFKVLLKINNDPILLYDEKRKIIILTIDLNYSNFSLLKSFPIFIYNIFSYTLPSVTTKKDGFVGEDFQFKLRGTKLTINNNSNFNKTFTNNFNYRFNKPGLYNLSQTLLSGKNEDTKIFIKTDINESNITKIEKEEKLELLKNKGKEGYINIDIYISLTIFSLLFILRILYYIKKL